jgi:hypothetical protein
MKTVKRLLVLVMISCAAVSCSNDSDMDYSNEDNASGVNTIEVKDGASPDEIPKTTSDHNDFLIFKTEISVENPKTNEIQEGIVTVRLDAVSEELVDIIVADELLDFAGITQAEFDIEIITYGPGDGDEDPNEDLSPHTACIEGCKDKYTDEDGNKIKGRGACKGNCWVDTTVRLFKAIL